MSAIVSTTAAAEVSPAYAQGGGASSTGTIQGLITDEQGGVVPGASVTASSPSLQGLQTTVSSETGRYRFPAVPPGTYTLTYSVSGFNTLTREGIIVALGFTATVNAQLAVATVRDTVVVNGGSPLIDSSATRVAQHFTLDDLQSIPNARDMGALLAITPAVQMRAFDVGGNKAGTVVSSAAYGSTSQVRVLVEGINITDGTGNQGFYFDYSSLQEAFIGTVGQSAEMPTPGVQSQFLTKSGGNRFNGEYYLDWYNNSLQGSNIPEDAIARGIRPHSNEIDRYHDTSINAGGPIRKDRLWWFAAYRTQFNAVEQLQFRFDKTFDTRLWNAVMKGTYQVNQTNRIIGYYQWGQKEQPNRLPYSTYFYNSLDQTIAQDSGSWVHKAEWNGTLSDTLYVEARYGDFGYYFPLLANSDVNYFWRDTALGVLDGAHQRWQLDRDRKQLTAAATYFLDIGGGSHTIKVGGELLKETGWEGYEQQFGGDIDHQYVNGIPSTVVFTLPTAASVGGMGKGAGGELTSRSALDVIAMFLNDSWAVRRLTLNAGLRYDRYHGWLPEQQQLAATVGPVSAPARTFAERPLYTWNQVAPRWGVIYDLTGDGRTVLKGNYGLFWHNPGIGPGLSANPNTPAKFVNYAWTDPNRDKRWQPGEEGARAAQSLAGAINIDPEIESPITHETSVWLERQLTDTMAMRAGYVYKTQDNLIQTYVPGRSVLNGAYSVAFPFTDIGVDGVSGTADDRVLTLYGMPTAQEGGFPLNQVVLNVPRLENFKTFEISTSRRYSNRWSGMLAYSYTWLHDYPTNAFPIHPNQPGVEDRTTWQFKATGSYDAAWGIRLTPVVRHQSGLNFAREIMVPGTAGTPFGLILPATTIYAEDASARREDHIWVFDVRAEKTVAVSSRVRMRAFVDLFNIANSHPSEFITRTTGPNFLRPVLILAPFTARIGFRVVW